MNAVSQQCGTLAALALCCAAAGATADSLGIEQPPDVPVVVLPADEPGIPLPPLPPGAVRQRLVRVRRDLIVNGVGPGVTEVALSLFDDLGLLRVRPKPIVRDGNGWMWSGNLVNRRGYVILRESPGGIYGIVRIRGEGDVVLNALRDDLVVASQRSASLGIACGVTRGARGNRRRQGFRDAESVDIDVAVLVSPFAVCGAASCGSDPETARARCVLQNQIGIWFDDANYMLNESDVHATLKWAGYDEFDPGERDDLDNLLQELNNPSLPRGMVVLNKRSGFSTDIVVVVVNQGTADGMSQPLDPRQPVSGAGNSAVAIVKPSTALDKMAFAHELGHTMGAGHEDGAFGYFASSRAFVSEIDTGNHTVMAITPGEPLPCYSNQGVPNPEKICVGAGIGDAGHDNAGTINVNRHAVANWRPHTSQFSPTCSQ